MLPLLRHRMKKQAEAFRARHARNIGGSDAPRHEPRPDRQEVLEGDYEVRDEPSRPARDRDGFD